MVVEAVVEDPMEVEEVQEVWLSFTTESNLANTEFEFEVGARGSWGGLWKSNQNGPGGDSTVRWKENQTNP